MHQMRIPLHPMRRKHGEMLDCTHAVFLVQFHYTSMSTHLISTNLCSAMENTHCTTTSVFCAIYPDAGCAKSPVFAPRYVHRCSTFSLTVSVVDTCYYAPTPTMQCLNHFGWTNGKVGSPCSLCADQNCHVCSANNKVCEKCKQKTPAIGPDPKTGKCVQCKEEGCSDCITNLNKCTQCLPNYKFVNGKCQACPVQNCYSCTANGQCKSVREMHCFLLLIALSYHPCVSFLCSVN